MSRIRTSRDVEGGSGREERDWEAGILYLCIED